MKAGKPNTQTAHVHHISIPSAWKKHAAWKTKGSNNSKVWARKKKVPPPLAGRKATAEKKTYEVETKPCEVLKPYEVEKEAGKVEKKTQAGPQKKTVLRLTRRQGP